MIGERCETDAEYEWYQQGKKDAAREIEASVKELADAMWQLLDDMREQGWSVSIAAKAKARLAYEPFRDLDDPDACKDWMTVEHAQKIIDEIETPQQNW
jgi:hypothetical protein